MVATTLKQREIAIIGYNTEDTSNPVGDSITFTLLVPIGSGTQIFFTDRAWNGTAFVSAANEGTFTYTAGADLPAGTIVTITAAQLAAAGMVLDSAGETIYVYQGAINTPSLFLYAADIADGNTTFNGSLTNTGLSVAAGTATAIAGDNGAYGDRGHNIQLTDLLNAISSPTNWTSDNDSIQQPAAGDFDSAPDQQIWMAFAGDAGLIRMSRDGVNTASQQLALFQGVDIPATYFNHPNEIVFDTVHGLFFVADSDNGNRRILQGNIADLFNPGALPTLIVLYTDQSAGTGGGQINGLAIDLAHNASQGALYFVNQDDLKRVVYDHDGTSPTNQTPVILGSVPAGEFASEIALDIASGRVWIVSTAAATTPITVPAGTPGAIFDPDSGTWYIVATDITNNAIYQVANVARSDTDATGNTVTALDLNGATAGTDLVDEQGLLSSIDVDPLTGHIYFTSIQINNGINGAVGGIYRYNLGTGAVEILYTEGNATDYLFKYIDVDPASGRYYVSNNSFESPGDINGTANNTSSVMVHALSAGAPTLFGFTPVMNSGVPWGLTIQNAPTLTGSTPAAAVTEASNLPSSGNTAFVLLFSSLVASDIDTVDGTDELAGALVRISGNFQSGATHQDFLTVNNDADGSGTTASGITFSYNSTTGVLTLSGPATTAEYAAALATVQFYTSGDDVTAYGAALNRTVALSVFDGLLYSDEITNVVTVTGINDAPVNANAGADSGAEDTTFNIAGLSVSDVDANPAAAGGQQLTVTLTVTRGTLSLNTGVAGGIVVGDIIGGAQNTATITIQATASEINATFASATGVQFTGGTNVNGTVTLTMVTNDGGFNGNDPGLTGTGTSEADSDNYTITVTAVNDAPTVSGDGIEDAAAIDEDVPLTNLNAPTVATLFGVQFSDAADDQTAFPAGSSPNTFAGIAVITNGSSGATGQWEYWNGAAWVNIGSPGAGSATFVRGDALIRFEPALNYNGNAPALVAHLVDNSAGSPTTNGSGINLIVTPPGGTSPYSSGTVTLNQAITPVNDAPVNTVPGSTLTLNEDATNVALTGLSVADVEAGPASQPLTVTFSVGRGTLTINTGVAGGINATHVTGGAGGASNQASITITATQAQINATLANATGLTYTPTSNVNGNDTLTMVTSDLGYTGTGGILTDTDMRTLGVTAINDAPTVGDGTESATAINEDTPNTSVNAQTVAQLFGPQFSDATDQVAGGSSANTMLGIAIVANGSNANGTWEWLNGAVWTAIGAASTAAAKTFTSATQIRFNPTTDFNGPAPTLTAHLVDNSTGTITNGSTVNISAGGSTGGTTRYSAGTVVLSQDVTAVNDGPLNTVPGTQTINEDATLTFSTGLGTAISVADADAAPGLLTVTLSMLNGQLTLSTLAGLSFGAGDGTDDTTMTFTGTAANINAALNGLLYETTLDYNGSDTLTITTNDNGNTGPPGALQDTDTVTINITAVADIVNDTLSFNEDSGAQSLTMPNNDTFENPGRSITAVTQGLHGFVAINDNNTSGDTSDDYVVYTQAADYNGTDSFTYTVTSGGVTETATVNVGIAAVADIADDTATVGEDSGTTTIDVIANDSFENGGFSITGVTQGLHGTVTIIDGPDADSNPDFVTYTPAADYNGSDSFTYTVTSGGVTETATVNVTITAIADAVDDVVSVAVDSVGNALNLLGNDTFESPARAITAVGAALHGTTAIHDNATPLNTADDYVTYTPTGGYTGPDSFTYTVTSGGVTETATVAVTVAPAGAAPVIDLDTGEGGINDSNAWAEGSFDSGLGTAIDITDADGTDISRATITITDAVAGDELVAPGSLPAGISVDPSSTATTLILIGVASHAVYEGVLGQVGYRSTNQNPTFNGTDTTRSITVVVNDGALNSNPAATMTMTIIGSNDAPAGADNTITRTEDAGAYTFTAADFPFSDVDGNTFAGVVISSLPAAGNLLYDPDGPGVGPAVLAMAGQFVTAAQLANGNLIYSPAGNGNGSPYSSFTFQVRDNGGTAGTGQDTDQLANTLTFNISAVNDAPVVDLNGAGGGISTSVNYTEDGAAVAIGSGVTVTDPDSGNGDMIDSATIVLTDRVAGDSLTVTGALPPGIVAVTTPTAGAITIQITGAGTGAQYQALIESIQYSTTSQDPTVGGTDLARTITVTVNDGEVDSAVATTTVNITALDDPAAALPDAFTITEAGSIVGGNVFANNGSGPDNDPDGPPLSVSAVSGGTIGVQFMLPSGALLTMNANGTFNYNTNNAFDTTPTAGSGASNTPAPDSFTYTLTGGGSAMVSLTITGLDTNDFLFGTGGTDSLTGGVGNDFYFVEQAADTANETAGQGFDVVWTTVSYVLAAGTDVEALSTRFWEGTGAINLTGNGIANNIYGNAGANLLDGGGGNDVLFGFGGNDSLNGGTGTDVMEGGTGDDFYFVDASGDTLIESASQGYDVAWTTASYVLAAGIEVEVLSARFWEDTTAIDLAGNALDNVLVGNNGINNLSGMGGNDILNGMGGNDILLGGAGNDRLLGGTGADAMFGGANDDFYFVDNSGDTATESASQGFDVVWTSVSYALAAGSEIEALSAISWEATDALTLVGNDLGNALYGNAGANILNGRGGNDTLVGFGGTDSFLFDSALGAGNVDTIADFSGPSDTIVLDDSVFAALTPGTLNANAFVIGTAALDADDRIIYDAATGALYYDADGNGAGLAVQFAILQGAPPINSSDFQVI